MFGRRVFFAAVLLSAFCLARPSAADRHLSPVALDEIAAIEQVTGETPELRAGRQDGRPTMVAGRLTLPRAGEPEQIARRFVADHPGLFAISADELVLERSLGHALGTTVRFSQRHRGLPVLGSALAVAIDDSGVVRIVSNALADLDGVEHTPAVAVPEAAEEARLRSSWALPADRGQLQSRLVVLALPGGARLAWEIHFGAVPALLSNMYAYVDATGGELIRWENRIVFDYTGSAFETNPGPYEGPYVDPIDVTLDIPEGGFVYTEPEYDAEMIPETACDYDEGAADCECPGDACVRLSHARFAARNCPDYHQTTPMDLSSMGLGEVNMHLCSEVQTAFADADDGFFYAWEGDNHGLNDLDGEDKFAEVQMFHQVSTIYDYFLTLMDDHPESGSYDWAGHEVMPLMATVNFKLPIDMSQGMPDMEDFANAANPDGELYPFDNAFFMPGSEQEMIPGFSRPFDSIVFGQGSKVDFAWDGDVIRHEFTHSVDNSVTGGGTASFTNFGDEWGVNPEPGGLSEGYADIYPAFMADEPTMGEYSLAAFGPGNERDLSGDDVCPNYLIGEVHADSPAWSQSLYQARDVAAGSDAEARHRFEQAAFVALCNFVPGQGFAEMTTAVLEAVETLIDADASAAAAEIFAAHGTDDCPRLVADDGSGTVTKSMMMAPSLVSGVQGDPYTPGIMQFAVTVDGHSALNVSLNVSSSSMSSMTGDSGEPDMRVLLAVDEPIQFEYDGSAVGTSGDVLGPFELDGDDNFSLVSNGGALPAGVYHVMLVNAGDGDGTLSGIEVAAADEAIAGEAGTQTFGDGDDGGADAGPDAGAASDGNSGGCGCTAPGAAPGAGGLALPTLLLLALAGAILRRS